jgi:SAM-dependent methyltransferase
VTRSSVRLATLRGAHEALGGTRAALSVLVRLLLVEPEERRSLRSVAELDACIERAFPGAPPRHTDEASWGELPDLQVAPPELALCHEKLLSRLERKRAGAWFTPPAVSRALARWALTGVRAGSVLDPAAGAGALLAAASEVVPESVELVGIDADPDAVLLARARLAGRANVRILHGDALATPELARELPDGILAPAVKLPRARAVIANPPFVASYARGAVALEAGRRTLLARRFPELGPGEGNTFLHFLLLALETAETVGVVVPDALLVNERYEAVRRLLARGRVELSVLDWPAFGAAVRAALLVRRSSKKPSVRVRIFPDEPALAADRPASEQTASARDLEGRPGFAFPRGATDLRLEEKIRSRGTPLGELCWVRDGINPGPRAFRERVLSTEPGRGLPCLEGKDVTPFEIGAPRLWVTADPSLLTPELKRKGASFREPWIFDSEKLVSRQTSPTLVFARDTSGARLLNSAHATGLLEGTEESLLYFLGVLNSSALRWYYARSSGETRRVFPQVHVSALRKLPVPRAGDRHGPIVALVRRLEARPGDEDALRALDSEVFALFGLTEAERRVAASPQVSGKQRPGRDQVVGTKPPL